MILKWNSKESTSLKYQSYKCSIYSLSETEYIIISRCTSIQEIWELLKVIHEGTSHVKDYNISLLTSQYDVFSNGWWRESINVMYNWFNDILLILKNLGKGLSSNEINRNLVTSLPIEWRPKLATIKEAKNLKAITTKKLLGSLIIHKHTLKRDWKELEVDKKKKKKTLLYNCWWEVWTSLITFLF